MNLIRRTRTLLAALLLGSAISLPGLQLAQNVLPPVAHAASDYQAGPVLAGTWVNDAKVARFSELRISAATSFSSGSALPTSILYGVEVFSIGQNRYIAYGTAEPVQYAPAIPVTFPLTLLPAPSGVVDPVHTTITLARVSELAISVRISDVWQAGGRLVHRDSTEIMYALGFQP